ncbi:MAG: hypothetical protein ACXW3Z_13835 [Limisphaerales bacterium]
MNRDTVWLEDLRSSQCIGPNLVGKVEGGESFVLLFDAGLFSKGIRFFFAFEGVTIPLAIKLT